MKTHIYIATTQGLVAIQNITPIDDEDISSVVSVNGTSTTANISNSYHNFVKKGVGIIQQMFGACSYRVDISARIDQGNSWQVAMYLAHLTQSKGLLGNGEVNQGDTVICATGEVNTTNHQVLAVSEVAVKFNLALPQLEQWTALGATVQFLLPQANQAGINHTHDQHNYTQLISNLEQAANALPNTAQNQTSPTVKTKKTIKLNFRYSAAAGISILILMLVFSLIKFPDDKNSPQVISKAVNNSNVETIQTAQLKALTKQHETCAATTSQNILAVKNTFTDLSLIQLCELYFQLAPSQVQSLLIARDAYTVIPLTKRVQGWQVPLPKNRLSDRSYFLVSMQQSLNAQTIERLRLYREAMPKAEMLTKSLLVKWMEKQKVEFSIYTHSLVVE